MSRWRRFLSTLEGVADEVGDAFTVRPRARARRQPLPSQNPLAVQIRRAAQPRPALPAPPRQLALPAPDPSKQLPPLASKPKGGQWWSDKVDAALNPEQVARRQAEGAVRFMGFVPEDEGVLLMGGVDATLSPEQEWLAKSLARYYKNDFGSPEDPLRSLAEQGLHYEPDMTPEKWSEIVNSYLMEDPIQEVLLPPNPKGGMRGAGSDLRGEVMINMPWLAKQPVTDKVYGISSGGLDLSHFEDELYNALNADVSGLPPELALRPESLARMSFPQAVERVGRINQFRVKQMEEQANAALNNPAIQTFKDYPEAGYRWVELRQPELTDALDTADDRAILEFNAREGVESRPEMLEMARKERARAALQDALQFEGDTMGHCVGGYCDDVLSGRSRIFSLRDAKGQPHVTIETAPNKPNPLFTPPEVYDRFREEVLAEMGLPDGPRNTDDFNRMDFAIDDKIAEWRAERATAAAFPDNIIQIKGKQNRAPVDDYLPYVQDFVKSGTWSNIGDFRNTGLVKLPDGRYITTQQAEEAIGGIPETTTMRRAYGSNEMVPTRQVYNPSSLDYMGPEEWAGISQYFEGYAIGGRVDASRCFSRNPLSVRR